MQSTRICQIAPFADFSVPMLVSRACHIGDAPGNSLKVSLYQMLCCLMPAKSPHHARRGSYPQHCTYSAVVILQLWSKYLPNSELSFVVSDAACAETHRISFEQQGTGKLYVGDPADSTFLKTIVDGQAGKFDVIIDDGKSTCCIHFCPTCMLVTRLTSSTEPSTKPAPFYRQRCVSMAVHDSSSIRSQAGFCHHECGMPTSA